MKTISVYIIITLLMTSGLFGSQSSDVAFFESYLNYLSADYPRRRVEALKKVNSSISFNEKQEIYRLVVENDLSYMRTTRSLVDLWNLRYQDKWETEVLYAAADTATFYIQYVNKDLGISGASVELGIINEIIEDLRLVSSARSKIATSRLVHAVMKLKQKHVVNAGADVWDKQKTYYVKAVRNALGSQVNKLNSDRMKQYLDTIK